LYIRRFRSSREEEGIFRFYLTVCSQFDVQCAARAVMDLSQEHDPLKNSFGVKSNRGDEGTSTRIANFSRLIELPNQSN
jgi:hypothetical protein